MVRVFKRGWVIDEPFPTESEQEIEGDERAAEKAHTEATKGDFLAIYLRYSYETAAESAQDDRER